MKNEPVITVAAIGAVIGAVITVLVAFGLPLSEKQTAAILGLWAIAGPLVLAWFQRSKVTPAS